MNNERQRVSSKVQSRDRSIVWALAVAAAIHVFVFSAAFPLFNNVDEGPHFDLVIKYCQNGIPQLLNPLSDEFINYNVLFSTPEYLRSPAAFPNQTIPPPPWTQPSQTNLPSLLAERNIESKLINYETTQSPLYYELAGAWWRLGKACGIHGGSLPYWLRFLNALLVPVIVWIGYWAAKLVFPDRRFVQLGVPALLAFMPQSVFYSISNDILSPLCFGLAFICLFRFWQTELPDVRLAAFTGLALAATFLAKASNLPILAVAGAVILLKIIQLAKNGKISSSLRSLATLAVCAGVPSAMWSLWCKAYFGDFTGSKIRGLMFGWTVKPFAQWWAHPIFTLHGLWTYFSGQMGTFWQGEIWWHGVPMALPGTYAVYSILTLVLVAAALPATFPKSSVVAPSQRLALQWSLGFYLAALVFFALMSVIYDFQHSPNPSPQHPYFHAGRMMLGALVPFVLLIVFGLDRLLNRFGNAAKWMALVSMVLFMLILEVVTARSIFFNSYNWFHLT
ncbi:MAG TPA: DUF2142 domain-containing protein [Verrucomicrobiae bacterium]|jgi:hypothetical protein|nr:DUF2142 domain-containing protein [Verrucomicrobiae bacterium]